MAAIAAKRRAPKTRQQTKNHGRKSARFLDNDSDKKRVAQKFYRTTFVAFQKTFPKTTSRCIVLQQMIP
jgi:hypothetical protein